MSRPDLSSTVQDRSAHAVDERFVAYYAERSLREDTIARFQAVQDRATALWQQANGRAATGLEVLDIGCGTGTSSHLWARAGHRVHGVDIGADLIEIARARAAELGHQDARFSVESATRLSIPDASVDVCIMPELLEHVADWRACVSEAARVLRPRGVLFLSTTNTICPVQHEFELPLYSWYPAPLKRYCERRALGDRPQWANFARYPAVNWFTYYGLRRHLATLGFSCRDRFDVAALVPGDARRDAVYAVIRAIAPLRLLGQAVTPATIIFAVKSGTAR